ncbi:putative ring finger domain-containing protein [Phaeoacremonium minimum UCRPA7]|uniref:Putative ring finger domain-containing protein n=1 Tax=Phaeoacremonium minimum (strain UCR-PA7) TaxID=1286976 RepID=R8BG80_PHAM7|nr:putative ring finger domain-containing protein [Phaeoacremonium minimum UCRPA7]EON98304.1 putative ring finger domain-containing protein [Phaeoacremonium minimum UCRPA7]
MVDHDLLFSNPLWGGASTIPSTIIKNITALSGQIAYSAHITENMTILSHKYAQTDNGIIQGLLYVPDLETNDPCNALSKAYIPSKVTRRADLPPTNYNLIAIAPWINPNCTQSYLASARVDPLRGFILYHPDNNTDKPPGANSEEWDLGDGGSWKVTNRYPIYAVSGVVGAEMMQQLHEYSGNVSQVPFGSNITALYDPDPMDYVRIWTEIRVSTPDGLPTMWIFILAVIGVLIFVVAGTSMLMHYITNGMVRRERAMRKLRDRIVVEDSDGESTHGRIHTWSTTVKKKIFRPSTRSLPIAAQERELRSRQSRPLSVTDETRLRMRALAGGGESDDGRSSSNGRPRWKRIAISVFPGFR